MQFASPRFSTITFRFASLMNGAAWLRAGMLSLLLVLGVGLGQGAQAQPELVEDRFMSSVINPLSLTTYTTGSTTKLCFIARPPQFSEDSGRPETERTVHQLYCTDGSSLQQITPSGGSSLQHINRTSDVAAYGSSLYFSAVGKDDGEELWSYDGSSVRQVADINAGSGSSSPTGFTVYDGTLYFQAETDSAGAEFWSYDGSSVSQVANIDSEGEYNSSFPSSFTVYDGTLYFDAIDEDSHGLWSYDGSSVSEVATFDEGLRHLAVYDGELYFSAYTGDTGRELWSYDGNTASLAADVNSGGSNSDPQNLEVYDGTLYFQATGASDQGAEFWSYDGSSASLVKDIYPGEDDFGNTNESAPHGFTVYNGTLYFFGTNSSGDGFWSYDGSTVERVATLGNVDKIFPFTRVYGGSLYIGSGGWLQSYDGSSVSQVRFSNNTLPGPEGEKVVYDGAIYFAATGNGDGQELWSYNGTSVSQVADINSGSSPSSPKFLTVYNGILYFSAEDGSSGRELWSYDGSTVEQAEDVYSGTCDTFTGSEPCSSYPAGLTVYDGTLYFGATSDAGRELWSYDGSAATQAAGISPTSDLMTVHDGVLYFGASTDSTGRELWTFDGSSAGQAADVNSGSAGSNPSELISYDGTLYFQANGGTEGTELWSYDGSDATRVENIYPGDCEGEFGDTAPCSSNPQSLTTFNGTLYFAATGDSEGRELWSYDGSTVSQIEDINPGAAGSFPASLTVFGNRLYFVAQNGSEGFEAHAYDGSSVSGIDLVPGGRDGGGTSPVIYDAGSGPKLYVTATNGTSGFELYRIGMDDPLPVELANFDAQLDDEQVRLTWQTASETNNAGFRIQRKVENPASMPNGQNEKWTQIGQVDGSGTTTEAQSYRFTDGDLPYEADALTYRLKQVDTDGTAHYSKTITVERGVTEVQLLGTYPNPARQQATVRYALPAKQDVTVRLYDVLGRQVRTVLNEEQEGRHERTLDVSSLPSGVYFLRLRAGGETRTQRLTVVQ